ncbi:molybdopterin-guanine dinucleotide biosynthesis protein B [Rhodovibrio sodomensis]|uniref:Molybdopterin-guanine dinucleotide biosynthesis protein B n=1 Tax=Rhodovibrio sodomensis TaxID=1088 RepID=A0ABS1DIZ2_9PROT|nr:molybdopterin-guanine dinucleotide biosynthesis protein B [Rhodovibrio sodomensis]MBK1669754.1 molybdopterin-guanine dinucleotide biosynthesis protein B [Rhodovibrio sodomensis]
MTTPPIAFGLAGWSGSGKTTLVRQLIPALVARGVRVSTIKHAHHDFDIDQPGKDSYEHRAAGAGEVLVSSARRWALMHEHRGAPEPTLDELIAKLGPCDLVLVEGFKGETHPKLEVYRPDAGKPRLAGEVPGVVAVASDAPLAAVGPSGAHLPSLDLNDVAGIAAFILDYTGLAPARGGRAGQGG